MKKYLLLSAVAFLVMLSNCLAQLTQVNESCEQMPCEEDLYCVNLKNGDQKCATCDQSTLNDLTGDVDEYCKGFEAGWTPETSPEFQNALAEDGRVLVDVFDVMLEKAKQCKESREEREEECWDGGDDDHLEAIEQVAESIDRISTHKNRQISDRRVYYGSTSTYESRLSTYNSKCNLNFPDITQKLDILFNSMTSGNKVDCDDIEDYGEECAYCLQAVKDLVYDGFRNNSSYIPDEYNNVMVKAEELVKKAEAMTEMAEDDDLCD